MYVRGSVPEENPGNYFIISMPGEIHKKIDKSDCYQFADFDYPNAQYYVIYAKGEKLRRELEEMGLKLVKLEAD